MAFYVGQKVVCVDASEEAHDLPEWCCPIGDLSGLEEGKVYTVREYGLDDIGLPTVWLQEIYRESHPEAEDVGEPGYSPRRFRPAVERKTDISLFKAMLNPSDVRETV